MNTETIKCPNCGTEIKVAEIISHNLEKELKAKLEREAEERIKNETLRIEENARKIAAEKVNLEMQDLKNQVIEKNNKIEETKNRELELRKKERQIVEKEESVRREYELKEDQLKKQLLIERKAIEEKAKLESENIQNQKLQRLEEELQEKTKRLEQSQEAESSLRKERIKLEEEKKAFELEVARKLDLERTQIAEKISRAAEECHKLKDAEKDKQLADLKQKIEDLQRKAELGSQQMQGEVLELELEQLLRNEFQFDEVEPVSKGQKGADLLQVVKTQSGKPCGKILWETKRTKVWSDGWIQKLKDDQREAKADISVLVSEALPKGFHHFRNVNDIWVTDIPSAISLALALRMVLIQVARAEQIQAGKEEKMGLVYNYFTGAEFRNHVQAIVESFVLMKKDLESEKRAMSGIWAKREKQIERIVTNLGEMHGDLDGIVGSSLPSVKILELGTGDEDIIEKK